ncbi:MAG TPA: DNA cytosine methyltransferase [Planctomycetaceae bacterium]|nr:DNA cytosine methyltransferase [Planctomycetaceae bacterium]
MIDRAKPVFGSLFAGIGGFDLGLERAGWRCKWQVEIDEYATQVLKTHWPHVPRYCDVRAFPAKCQSPWLRHRWGAQFCVDLVCAGFPCQDVSTAAGAGIGSAFGKRTGLWTEILRVACELGRPLVLLENVPAIVNRGWDRIVGAFSASGYSLAWEPLSAVDFSLPIPRTRLFAVAVPDSVGWLPNEVFDRLADSRAAQETRKVQRDGILGRGGRQRVRRPPPPGVRRVVDGLPTKVDRERVRCIGNAVCPVIAEAIGRALLEAWRTIDQ